jgi:hypothetical protein
MSAIRPVLSRQVVETVGEAEACPRAPEGRNHAAVRETMARRLPKPLLAAMTRVKVFNSGLDVWLYDRSFRTKLKASGAFETDADAGVSEAAVRGFVRKGLVMGYGLMQDDGLDIAVGVRAPLTVEERGSIPWRRPQQGFLRLPTGRLVIESNDALTIRTPKPTDPGAEVKVPPGDYLVTLHRVDWDVFAEDEIEWEGPSEYITLTGGSKARPVRGQPAVLPWEAPEAGADALAWEIADGAYQGAVIFDDDLMAMRIAIDEKGVSRLGLQDKWVGLLSVPAIGFECAVVWVRGDRRQGAYYDRLERLGPPAACAGKEWAICNLQTETPGDQTLFCLRRDATVKIPRRSRGSWHRATMQVLEARAIEKR